MKKRSKLTKTYHNNPTLYNKEALLSQVNKCTELIIKAKEEHIAKMSSKLDNPGTAPKTYWSIINRFINNKKIPVIPPILVDGDLISHFKEKAN